MEIGIYSSDFTLKFESYLVLKLFESPVFSFFNLSRIQQGCHGAKIAKII